MIEYMADNNEMLIQILQTLNNFQLQTTAAFSEVRAEIKKSREIENEHWQENLRRWDENDKRWEENDRRWAENDKRWEENKKLWEENKKLWKENEINRKNDKNDILNILINYDISISTQLKDKNVSKMYFPDLSISYSFFFKLSFYINSSHAPFAKRPFRTSP